jgi:hypothetical protein
MKRKCGEDGSRKNKPLLLFYCFLCGGKSVMKKVCLFLLLAGISGMSVVKAAEPCRNCRKDTYSSRNSENRNFDNNRVPSYKKDALGRHGVSSAADAGGLKLSHKHLKKQHRKNM